MAERRQKSQLPPVEEVLRRAARSSGRHSPFPDVVLGLRRFDQFLDSLGVASNVLTDRLNRLVDEGVLERVPYSERPERFEYRLTKKGRELGVALLALMQWGDRHLSDKPPRIARRRSDRSPVSVRLVAKDGSAIAPGDLELLPGPGAQPT